MNDGIIVANDEWVLCLSRNYFLKITDLFSLFTYITASVQFAIRVVYIRVVYCDNILFCGQY